MALKPLKVRITGDTTQLEQALGRAGRNLKGFATAAAAAGTLVAGALSAMTAQGLKAIDAQAKLARSLGTTTASMQVLERAGSLAGVSMQGIEQATKDLTRRLSQAAAGAGPAKDALKRLGLTAKGLADLPLDERIDTINSAIRRFIPAAQQAAVAGQLFGEEGSIAISRLDSATIRQATSDIQAFGIAVSDEAAAKIELANDALSRMTLVFEGLRNKLAVEVAPVLQTLADRFNTLASSGAVQAAIERLVGAFGSLADIILSEEFINVAVSGLELLANTAAGAAELMVGFANNIEMVTIAFSGLAIAMAVAGGPLTLIVGALAVALVGIAKWRSLADDASKGSDAFAKATDEAKKATDNLNAALETFQHNATEANQDAVDRAVALKDQAMAAVAAARAEDLLNKAYGNGGMPNLTPGEGPALGMTIPQATDYPRAGGGGSIEGADAIETYISGLGISTAPSVSPVADIPTPSIPGKDDDDKAIPGLGGAGAVTDQLAARLEALQQGLATEEEVLAEWRETSMQTLDDALARKLLTEEEYLEARTRMEEEFADRSAQIEKMRGANNAKIVADGMNDILSAAATGNQKIMRVQKIYAAGMAWIDTLQGAARELRKGTFGFASAAAVIAKGVGFVSAIKGVSDSGYGGGASGGSAVSSAAEVARPVQNVQIDLVGATAAQVDQYQTFADTLNEAARQGLLTQITVAG